MKRKNVLILALTLCTVAILAVGASLAYFTDKVEAKNTFTVGEVQIDLTETLWDSEGVKDGRTVYPGEALAKNPVVQNKGQNPCFVRIKVEGLNCLIPTDLEEWENPNNYMITLRGLSTEWEDGGDGYYYYKHVLFPPTNEYVDGEPAGRIYIRETPPLFDHIVIPFAIENAKDGEWWKGFDVYVKAEAVQAQGALPSFSQVELMNVTAIKGWFATCGL